jgi:hypothetical protein
MTSKTWFCLSYLLAYGGGRGCKRIQARLCCVLDLAQVVERGLIADFATLGLLADAGPLARWTSSLMQLHASNSRLSTGL